MVHISSILAWLPMAFRIDFWVSLLILKAVVGLPLPTLPTLFLSIRSALRPEFVDQLLLTDPGAGLETETEGRRPSAVKAPLFWKPLGAEPSHCPFGKVLETVFFNWLQLDLLLLPCADFCHVNYIFRKCFCQTSLCFIINWINYRISTQSTLVNKY